MPQTAPSLLLFEFILNSEARCGSRRPRTIDRLGRHHVSGYADLSGLHTINVSHNTETVIRRPITLLKARFQKPRRKGATARRTGVGTDGALPAVFEGKGINDIIRGLLGLGFVATGGVGAGGAKYS